MFQDWFENWTPTEKENLLEHFNQSDPEFAAKLNKASHISQTEADDVPQTSTANEEEPPSPRLPQGAVNDDDNKDDGVSPGSHSSSPLSSLSQPLSPHDSGLEETHSDSETTPPPNDRSPDASSGSGESRETENATPTPDNIGAVSQDEEATASVHLHAAETPSVTAELQEAI